MADERTSGEVRGASEGRKWETRGLGHWDMGGSTGTKGGNLEPSSAGTWEGAQRSIVNVRTLGLYSAFRARSAIAFKSSRMSRFTVATMFLHGVHARARQRENALAPFG